MHPPLITFHCIKFDTAVQVLCRDSSLCLLILLFKHLTNSHAIAQYSTQLNSTQFYLYSTFHTRNAARGASQRGKKTQLFKK